MSIPARNESSIRNKDFYKARLTDDGILITSLGHFRRCVSDSSQDLLGNNNSSTTLDSGQSNGSFLETASLISCVTCLSDTEGDSNVSRNGRLGNGSQLSANTVIPFGRILNAKYLNNPHGFVDSNSPNPFGSDEGNGNEEDQLIEITLAKPRRHDIVPKRIVVLMSNISSTTSSDIVEEILDRSYKNVKRERSILVIINPYGGKKNAKKLFMSKCKPILLASKCSIDMAYTKYAGHAIDIAREVDIDKYDTIACASGDGIPYEVINGLFQRHDKVEAFNKFAITQLPCGSGNAMSVSCHWTSNPSYAALCLVKSIESRIDLMCCSQQSYYNESPRLSFLSQTYGIIAESDINTEFIRWMGPARFELGVAFNVLQRKKYPCDIYVKYAAKTKNDLKVHYLTNKKKGLLKFESISNEVAEDSDLREKPVTEMDFKLKYPLDDGIPDDWERIDSSITDNLGIFYTGKMPYIAADTKFFPAALPSDGAMDLVITDARTPVTRMAPILLGLDRGSHVLQPEVIHSKIIAYKLVPKITSSLFSVDGEKFPLEPLQCEVLPGLCKTLLRNGCYVDTEFDSM